MTFADDTLLEVASGNLSSDLDDETVILNVDEGVYYGMNPVAAFVWHRLQNSSTFGDIKKAVEDEFDVDEVTCRRDLVALLTNFANAGLIQVRRKAA